MEKLPETVDALNAFVNAHFHVLKSSRAYEEFDFPVKVGFDGEDRTVSSRHRVVHITLAFRGSEEECCKCLAAFLRDSVTHEKFLDAEELLFVRRNFGIEKDDFDVGVYSVSGRIGFWDTTKNKKLMSLPCYKPEGAIANKAVMPKFSEFK